MTIGDNAGAWIDTRHIGWLRWFARVALAGNRYGIDWQAFADRFMLPGVVYLSEPFNRMLVDRTGETPRFHRDTRYWRRRLESNRRRANRRARRA